MTIYKISKTKKKLVQKPWQLIDLSMFNSKGDDMKVTFLLTLFSLFDYINLTFKVFSVHTVTMFLLSR